MKKQTKQTVVTCVAGCSTRHKILGLVALMGLFACGWLIGYNMGNRSETDVATSDKTTCMVIEEVLMNRLHPENTGNPNLNLENAEIYSMLMERGCPEHTEQFKALGQREIDIATALVPMSDITESETEIVIDAYKKLDMQREAQEFLNKVQKLTNPAIDFILQMQQIINE